MPKSLNPVDTGTPTVQHDPSAMHIPVIPRADSLGLFLAITFVLCVVFDLLFPNLAMRVA